MTSTCEHRALSGIVLVAICLALVIALATLSPAESVTYMRIDRTVLEKRVQIVPSTLQDRSSAPARPVPQRRLPRCAVAAWCPTLSYPI